MCLCTWLGANQAWCRCVRAFSSARAGPWWVILRELSFLLYSTEIRLCWYLSVRYTHSCYCTQLAKLTPRWCDFGFPITDEKTEGSQRLKACHVSQLLSNRKSQAGPQKLRLPGSFILKYMNDKKGAINRKRALGAPHPWGLVRKGDWVDQEAVQGQSTLSVLETRLSS